MKFSELNLDPNLLKSIHDTGFTDCMPVQEESFAHTLLGKDVCVQSQTGSGKTAAFVISIYQLFIQNEKLKNKKALIIAPIRELAVQIEKEASQLGQHLNFKTGCFFGGVGYSDQEDLLKNGVDIIIGTPGRLIDFSEQRKINFADIGILVIDEADRLFDMGFYQDIVKMVRKMPPPGERITMLYSATLNDRVKNLAWEYMKDPVEIEMSPEQLTVENVTQELYHVSKDEKLSLLLGIMRKENPRNAIIFTNMKVTAHEVAKRLELNGYKCEYIIGDLPQSKRTQVIDGIKSGKIQFLVATDVAARGLHIDDLDLVVNYDLPEDKENYVHRIGRTARAGKKGKAISLVCERYVYNLEPIETLINEKIASVWDDTLIIEDKSHGKRIYKEDSGIRGAKHPKDRFRVLTREKSVSKKKNVKPYKNARPVKGRNSKEQTISFLADDQVYEFSASPDTANYNIDEVVKEKSRKTKQPSKPIKANKKGSVEERMLYYKEKYGANFQPSPELLKKMQKEQRPNIFNRMFGFLRKRPKS